MACNNFTQLYGLYPPSSDIIYTNTKDEVYLRVGDETKK